MRPMTFPGTYEDAAGREPVVWTVRSLTGRGFEGRYGITTTVRGVELEGLDLDGLEPVAPVTGTCPVSLDQACEVSGCVLTGDVPALVEVDGERVAAVVRFTLDRTRVPETSQEWARYLTVSVTVDGRTHQRSGDSFETAVQALQGSLAPHRLLCCFTCRYSDYDPGGKGLTGMRCHRDAKERYLRVTSKLEYWGVPVTEDVPELYRCDEYDVREPGTGYRG